MSTFFKLKTSNDNKSNLNISKSDTITLDLLGFTIDQQDGRHIIKWTDIERLQAYKVDLLTKQMTSI